MLQEIFRGTRQGIFDPFEPARRVVGALEVIRIKNFPDVEKRLGLDATRNHREHPGSSFPAR